MAQYGSGFLYGSGVLYGFIVVELPVPDLIPYRRERSNRLQRSEGRALETDR